MNPKTRTMRSLKLVALVSVLTFSVSAAMATPPPQAGGTLPAAFRERAASLPANVSAFTFNRSLTQVTQRAVLARAIASVPLVSPQGMPKAQQDAIEKLFGSIERLEAAQHVNGQREIPVIAIKFAEQATPPFPITDLQRELFDGPWPTGTMQEYYREISGGRLSLTGNVFGWVNARRRSTHYEGEDFVNPQTMQPEPCYGTCTKGKADELMHEALNAPANVQLDWGRYDNDGPDGVPNSGDDDGYVDFVAFVHSERGGECLGAGNRNIWSHRWSLSALSGEPYETRSPKNGGGFILIDDYVIQPGLACDGKKMIEIGVFAHEFGHAFGLPDLYDTDPTNGTSAGVGNWCLMAGGSWGGDNQSPERPSHMSPWAKAFLGWIDVKDVTADEHVAAIDDIHDSRVARRISISGNMYYLIANVQQRGFDAKLPAPGLQVWRINQTVLNRTLANNTVNANEFNRGVELVEADGNKSLNEDDPSISSRGQPGDVYPGTSGNRTFDASSSPSSLGRVAACNISDPGSRMTADLLVSRNQCGTPSGPSAVPPFTQVPQVPGQAQPAGGETQPTEAAAEVLNVAALRNLPDGARVRAQGVLENVGSSYFKARERQIALVSEDGVSTVDVNVGKALENRLPQTPGARPALPSVLGKPVIVNGTIEWVQTAKGKEVRLKVDSVAVVEEQ